ncbi:MAG: DUF1415 domain-containing protein [Thiothrix sp.]|nr:MAG: DUF1415 domain-containing protein [Thiothrix sp.]
MPEDTLVIEQTRLWVKSVIVGHNFCPFAYREVERDSIRYRVIQSNQIEICLETMIEEYDHLDSYPETETTLVIFPGILARFEDFTRFIELAEALLRDQGYEGEYQLASFHPKYQFADATIDDPANYTNRSPYPSLHIIREASIEKAVAGITTPEQIPERNIEVARNLGNDVLQGILDRCHELKGDKPR